MDQINYLGDGNDTKLFLDKNRQLKVEQIEISDTSLVFLETDSAKYSTIPINQINRITFTDHKAGLGYGILVGTATGVLFGIITIEESSDMAGMGVLVYGSVGMLVGTVFGAIAGSDRNYIFISNN
jgi:hypothetical protein